MYSQRCLWYRTFMFCGFSGFHPSLSRFRPATAYLNQKHLNMRSRIHIALLGGTILDNAPYVAEGKAVASHFRNELQRQFPDTPTKVTLLARDGATLAGIAHQFQLQTKIIAARICRLLERT
ncbi:hypothetical protein BC832DRAFT_312807 [Gaertneriomyces semiglobifer]|nr:hypothetical protein BC832DRAFT_312807 [Gaertneriomyces semiglobifer]